MVIRGNESSGDVYFLPLVNPARYTRSNPGYCTTSSASFYNPPHLTYTPTHTTPNPLNPTNHHHHHGKTAMSQPLFGLVPANHPVIINPTQTPTPTTFLYAIPPPSQPGSKPFSHIVVFLLPGIALPPGTAAAIYLVTPPTSPAQAEPNSRFLGGIGPGKESAIFKLGTAGAASDSNVVIGVSVEPAESVAARIAEVTSAPVNSASLTGAGAGAGGTSGALVPAAAGRQQPSTLVLAQRIIKNAFNFLASFSGTAGQVEVVPLKAFEEWWRKFEGRVRSDPGFLERDD